MNTVSPALTRISAPGAKHFNTYWLANWVATRRGTLALLDASRQSVTGPLVKTDTDITCSNGLTIANISPLEEAHLFAPSCY